MCNGPPKFTTFKLEPLILYTVQPALPKLPHHRIWQFYSLKCQTKNTGSVLHSPLHFIPYIQSSRTPFVFIFKLYTESDHYSPPIMLPSWPKPPSCLSGLFYHLSNPPASSLDPLISNTVKNVGQMTFPQSLELTSYIT